MNTLTEQPAPLLPASRWRLAPPPPAPLVRALPDLHPVLVTALGRRGALDADGARALLAGAVADDSPFDLAGMPEAVTRLRAAVRDREPIVVYGDFDADGVTATAVLVETLTALGGRVGHFIPHRERDGYGLNVRALERIAADGASLVVTVDCGVRAVDEIALAVERGLDVIITDHHTLPASLPDATAVVNPHRPDCPYPHPELSGAGLAFKLAQALLRVEAHSPANGGLGLDEAQLLDLVAIGTVADVVPLVGENRALVRRGLDVLRRAERPGIGALLSEARRAPEDLTSRDIAFSLGPRINAAGRMAHADMALALLLTRDPREAAQLAGVLEGYNRLRREATDSALASAEAALAPDVGTPFLLHVDDSVPLGVVGLVAGQLAERHTRPAAVLRLDGDLARGSARSIRQFNVIEALEAAPDLLVRFGGHARAAGFTVRRGDIEALRAHLTRSAQAVLEGADLRPVLDIEAEVAPGDLDWRLHDALSALEPFGEGNSQPLLLLRGASVASAKRVGADHLRFVVEGGPGVGSLDAIAFRQASRLEDLGARADLVFTLEENVWRGRRKLELQVRDAADPGVAATETPSG